MSQTSFKKIAEDKIQPKDFSFDRDNMILAKKILKIYPKNYKESSIMPLLSIAQNQNNGWLPKKAIEYVSSFLEIPEIKVLEIATFYSMYNLAPVGKYFVQVCTTSPCLIRGADKIVKICKEKISKEEKTLSENKLCSWVEVECLGACVNGPMIQVNDDYYEDLDEKSTDKIVSSLISDKPLKPKSFRGRTNTAPEKDRAILNGEKNA